MRKLFLTAFSVVTLVAMFSSLQIDTFAANRKPKVKSGRQRCKVCNCGAVICRCKSKNKFKSGEDVSARGKRFTPFDTVDIYVTSDRVWSIGDIIDPVISMKLNVAVNPQGKFECTKIWEDPLTSGEYDIVVDANQDGIYNAGDAIDGKEKVGFRVK